MRLERRNQFIYARYQRGASQREIGQLYGLSQSAVSKIIRACHQTISSKPTMAVTRQAPLLELLKEENTNDVVPWIEIWRIQTLVKEEFGIYYTESYIRRRIKEMTSRSPQVLIRCSKKSNKEKSNKLSFINK